MGRMDVSMFWLTIIILAEDGWMMNYVIYMKYRIIIINNIILK